MDLSERVAELETEVRALKTYCQALAQGPATVSAPFSVVDAQERIICSVKASQSGPMLELFDERGRPGIALGALDEGQFKAVLIYGRTPEATTYLSMDGSGSTLRLSDSDGRRALQATCTDEGGPSVQGAASNENPGFRIRCNEGGGHVEFSDDGGVLGSLSGTTDGLVISLRSRSSEGVRVVRISWDHAGEPVLELASEQ